MNRQHIMGLRIRDESYILERLIFTSLGGDACGRANHPFFYDALFFEFGDKTQEIGRKENNPLPLKEDNWIIRNNMKRIVTYFSASGVTARVAERLADAIGADLFEIQPEEPYTKADLDWMDKKSRSSVEMSNPESRPGIKEKRDDMRDYDTIFVGFPIWWYIAPTIINTFLESYNFNGKTIIPFATSGGSGMGDTNKMLLPSCKGAEYSCAVTPPDRQIGNRLSGLTETAYASLLA